MLLDDLDPDHKKPPRKASLFARMRGNFLAGLVVIAPIGLTMWLTWSVVGWIDSWVLPFVPYHYRPEQYIGINLRGVGVVFFLLFTMVIGWMGKGILGRSLLRFGENLVDRMPVVRSIYNGLKQIAETVFSQRETSFEKACLVEYPRRGIWAIAFISTTAKGEVAHGIPTEGGLMSVFLPTTPNPTSGFLLFVPKADIIELDMTVEDAAKLVISAGLVYPNKEDPSQPPAELAAQ
ncbi:putative membrane protein [Litoreibacter meonggei]|uniref:Putative membrane protein n=2 Tax=Litoreibacter meonggei TaxID=1049199 RepID=A0A497VUY7_9RHOB|nr:putative membrane protein [Litoreibacter meonggei]